LTKSRRRTKLSRSKHTLPIVINKENVHYAKTIITRVDSIFL